MPWRKGNRLRLVTEEEADNATRQIFADIKRTLGLPVLKLFYPALAVYPTFLRLHWEALQPIAGSREMFSAADCLRADAYTRVHNYFQVRDLSAHKPLRTDADAGDVSAIAEFYHHVEPLLLLLACYQMQALEGAAGQTGTSPTPQSPRWSLHLPSCSVDEQSAPAALKKKFEEIRRLLGVPFINPEYCAFADWPEFLSVYWDALKQMLASPVYDECRYGVRSTAWSLTAQLPGPTEMTLEQLTDAGMTLQDVASVARMMELFITNLSGQLLNVAAAKIALEGGNLAIPESQRVSRTRRKQPAA
jgi:hypothetical protein